MIDYTTTVNREGSILKRAKPMRCNDCNRPALYDYEDDQYHHAVDAGRGCFLIGPEDRPDDRAHPLYEQTVGT